MNLNARVESGRKEWKEGRESELLIVNRTKESSVSSGGRTDSIQGGEGDGEMREDLYEEAFARMKKAAGVSDIDEVVRRFETQEETTKHLLELQVMQMHHQCLVYIGYKWRAGGV